MFPSRIIKARFWESPGTLQNDFVESIFIVSRQPIADPKNKISSPITFFPSLIQDPILYLVNHKRVVDSNSYKIEHLSAYFGQRQRWKPIRIEWLKYTLHESPIVCGTGMRHLCVLIFPVLFISVFNGKQPRALMVNKRIWVIPKLLHVHEPESVQKRQDVTLRVHCS